MTADPDASPDAGDIDGDGESSSRSKFTRREVVATLAATGAFASLGAGQSGGGSGGGTVLGIGGGSMADAIGELRVKTYVGTMAERPSAGVEGRVFKVWDPSDPDNHGAIFYDDGTAWELPTIGSSSKPVPSITTESLVNVADYVIDPTDDIADIINNQMAAGELAVIGRGTHTYSTTPTPPTQFGLVGMGRQSSVLDYDGAGDGIDLGNATDWFIRDVKLQGDAGTSDGLNLNTAARGEVRNVTITGFGGRGIFGDTAVSIGLHHVRSDGNTGTGCRLESSSNAVYANRCDFTKNGSHAVTVVDSSALTFDTCVFEGNDGIGFFLVTSAGSGARAVTIRDGFFDGNLAASNSNIIKASTANGVPINGFTVESCFISGRGAGNGNNAIGVDTDVSMRVVGGHIEQVDTAINDPIGADLVAVDGVTFDTSSINTLLNLSNTVETDIGKNDGYLGRNSGEEDFTGDGSITSFTIAHGLGAAPSAVNLTQKAVSSAGEDIEDYDVDATNITVNFTAAPANTETATVGWMAEV